MIGAHELFILPSLPTTVISNMGGSRNRSGAAEEARGLVTYADKHPSRSISPNSIARVRRNLFGSNSLSSKTFLDNELSKLRASQNEKWNFDFSTGKPLNKPNGKYIWERVGDRTSAFNSTTGTQKFIQKKMTDYMGKRKISPTSSLDKSKSIKTDVHSSHTSYTGKTSNSF